MTRSDPSSPRSSSSNFFTRAVPPIKRDTTCDSFVKLLKSFFSRDFTLSRASFSNRCERNKATFSFLFFFHPGTCIHFFSLFFPFFFSPLFLPSLPILFPWPEMNSRSEFYNGGGMKIEWKYLTCQDGVRQKKIL